MQPQQPKLKTYHIPYGMGRTWDAIPIGAAITLFGLVWIYQGYWLAIVLLPAVIIGAGIRKGMQLDFENHTYRYYYSVWGHKFGKWQRFPQIEYISIYQITTKPQEDEVDSYKFYGENEVEKSGYRLQFVAARYTRIEIGIFSSREDALEAATPISRDLQLQVLDATTSNRQWLGVL